MDKQKEILHQKYGDIRDIKDLNISYGVENSVIKVFSFLNIFLQSIAFS